MTDEPRKCGGFGCEGDVRCRTACADDTQCAKGYVCIGVACQPDVSKCNAEGTEKIDAKGKSTPCAPYVCKGGACLDGCTSTAECAPGSVCDSGQCVDPTAPSASATEDSGGCAVGRSPSGALGVIVALAGLSVRRRRRVGRGRR